MYEVWRVPFLALASLLGVIVYMSGVVFADYIQQVVFPGSSVKSLLFLPFICPYLGGIIGLVTGHAWWAYKCSDFEAAEKICNTWGLLILAVSVAGLVALLEETYGRGLKAILTFLFWFFLGAGMPLPWSFCLLMAPRWLPRLQNILRS